MASLSTHVLDTSQGRPAEGIRITFESAEGERLAEGTTDVVQANPAVIEAYLGAEPAAA